VARVSFLKVAGTTPMSSRAPVQDAVSAARAVAKEATAAIRSIASSRSHLSQDLCSLVPPARYSSAAIVKGSGHADFRLSVDFAVFTNPIPTLTYSRWPVPIARTIRANQAELQPL
jgi:hypothetical protein